MILYDFDFLIRFHKSSLRSAGMHIFGNVYAAYRQAKSNAGKIQYHIKKYHLQFTQIEIARQFANPRIVAALLFLHGHHTLVCRTLFVRSQWRINGSACPNVCS